MAIVTSTLRQAASVDAIGAKARSAVGLGGIDSPRAVTRGESPEPMLGPDGQAAKCDWLNCTFQGPESRSPVQFVHLLSRRVFHRPLQGLEQHGIFGFEKSVKLFAFVGSRSFPIGCIAWGGEQQKGRWMLQLTGAGCQVVTDWKAVRRLLHSLDARITRLDLAVDFMEGEYSVDDAVAMYKGGEFTSQGRAPSTHVAGDWINGKDGRTFYVGKAANGKMLRAYEKGIQMGDAESKWVRFEVQIGNRDRVIPLDALVMRDAYYAGCYPALQAILGCAAEHIETTRTAGCVSMTHLFRHLQRSYGKFIGLLGAEFMAHAAEFCQVVSVVGVPRRLNPSALTSGITWQQLLDNFKD